VGLTVEGGVPLQGARIGAGDREIGVVTSAASSPTRGSIALGYVHRDFTAPGTDVTITGPGATQAARVIERPMPPIA
jgi:aminomethyltransferase